MLFLNMVCLIVASACQGESAESRLTADIGGNHTEESIGVWQGVNMDCLKFHLARLALPFYALWAGDP
jgi:hypothetical protein